MRTLTISSDDEHALEQVKKLAEALHIPVMETEDSTNASNGKNVAALFEQLARGGRIAELVPDPVSWQLEQRKDRKLPFREQ